MDGEGDAQRNKIDAIYDLRAAVESKAHLEHVFAADTSPAARDALLAAQLDVEAKTQDAIDVCHECGHPHPAADGHVRGLPVSRREENVIHVDFRRGADAAEDQVP
jgi:hypothetical protein